MALVVGTNAFIDVVSADAYFADSLQEGDWLFLNACQKSQALVTAARRLNPNLIAACQLPIDVGDITANLANANAELALVMVLTPATINQANTGSNTKRVRAGTAEVEFFRPTDRNSPRFPTQVTELLRGCLSSSASTVTGACASGLDQSSSFTDPDQYGLREGYP